MRAVKMIIRGYFDSLSIIHPLSIPDLEVPWSVKLFDSSEYHIWILSSGRWIRQDEFDWSEILMRNIKRYELLKNDLGFDFDPDGFSLLGISELQPERYICHTLERTPPNKANASIVCVSKLPGPTESLEMGNFYKEHDEFIAKFRYAMNVVNISLKFAKRYVNGPTDAFTGDEEIIKQHEGRLE